MKQKERFDVVISGHFFENIIGATNIYVEPKIGKNCRIEDGILVKNI